jgi:hypothetical protein
LIPNLFRDDVSPSQIAFRKRDHGALHAEICQNLQVLFGLLHPSVIGGDDKECEVDRADACDHVANEILMAWNINDACVNLFASRRGQIQFSETKIDCDVSLLFFRQPIGICSSQRFYQCALAMIDVPRGRNDEMPSRHFAYAARIA